MCLRRHYLCRTIDYIMKTIMSTSDNNIRIISYLFRRYFSSAAQPHSWWNISSLLTLVIESWTNSYRIHHLPSLGLTQITVIFILQACRDTFSRQRGAHSFGGVLAGDRNTMISITNCEDLCFGRDECVGFDWALNPNIQNRCWLHTMSSFEARRRTEMADQYKKVACTGKILMIH